MDGPDDLSACDLLEKIEPDDLTAAELMGQTAEPDTVQSGSSDDLAEKTFKLADIPAGSSVGLLERIRGMSAQGMSFSTNGQVVCLEIMFR